ncbi:MAG TPA: hypothetical protein VI488_14470 [Candidatus Angelobacter sp.]
MSTKNPLTYGFRAIRNDPSLLLVEVLWRWCCGAVVLLLLSGFLVVHPVAVAAADTSAWSSRDPLLVAQAFLHVLAGLGGTPLLVGVGLLLPATALWTFLGAFGRTFTLNRLEPSGVSFRSILALQTLRALFLWIAGAALAGTIALDARTAGRGAKPDIFLYSAVAAWSVILIGVLWGVVNWQLSLAAVCCAKYAGGFGRSIRQALGLSRSHSGDLLGVSLVFAIWRLVTVAVLFVLWFLPSGVMGTSPRAYFAWLVTTLLAYLVAGDALYVSRMAGYLAIDPLESDDKETDTLLPGASGNKSTPR